MGESMKIIVWGLAAGTRSTRDAASGAFTWREYKTENFPRRDWLKIFIIEKG